MPKKIPPELKTAYLPDGDYGIFSRYLPVFLIENNRETYNLVGTPRARFNEKGKEDIFVSPGRATIYYGRKTFHGEKGVYTNLIYRVHFKEVPFSLLPFHLGYGKNVGLFAVVTLNDKNEPVLLTTVHTCGCYIAFVPTSHLPDDSYPEGWEREKQSVYGEKLPGRLEYPEAFDADLRPVISIRSGTHRVKNLHLEKTESIERNYVLENTELRPLGDLDRLAMDDKEYTSFFELTGSRKGYVKESHKPLERLLMSWWLFDWRVGEDKKLGDSKKTGTVFYTSLKFWDRKKSDMWHFANFYKYWGWKL